MAAITVGFESCSDRPQSEGVPLPQQVVGKLPVKLGEPKDRVLSRGGWKPAEYGAEGDELYLRDADHDSYDGIMIRISKGIVSDISVGIDALSSVRAAQDVRRQLYKLYGSPALTDRQRSTDIIQWRSAADTLWVTLLVDTLSRPMTMEISWEYNPIAR
jgi:hypothetical protein